MKIFYNTYSSTFFYCSAIKKASNVISTLEAHVLIFFIVIDTVQNSYKCDSCHFFAYFTNGRLYLPYSFLTWSLYSRYILTHQRWIDTYMARN